jgi:hypothetical protein
MAIDILLVSLACGFACVYAFLKLAPRNLRERLGARLGGRAADAAKSGSCSGCGGCDSTAEAEFRVAVSTISRRR